VHRTLPEFCPLLCIISDTVIYVMMLSFAGIVLCDCLGHAHLHSHTQTGWSREESVLCEV